MDSDVRADSSEEQSAPDVLALRVSAWRRRRRSGDGTSLGVVFWLAVVWFVGLVLATVFADLLPLPDPNAPDIDRRLLPPLSEGSVLGTDGLGRDLLSRTLYGARVSLGVSVGAVVVGVGVGGLIGLTVGFVRGRLDAVVMPVVDLLLAFPGLVLILALVAFIGRSATALVVVLGLISVPSTVRIVRANTLHARGQGWVLAAQAEGAPPGRIIVREIAPIVAPPLATIGLLGVGLYIVVEGGLGYLGLSVPPPTPTWGAMIEDGQQHIRKTPWTILVPGTAMFLTVLSLNLIGDVLRERWNVKGSSL